MKTVKIADDIHQALKIASAEKQIPIEGIVRAAIIFWFARGKIAKEQQQ